MASVRVIECAIVSWGVQWTPHRQHHYNWPAVCTAPAMLLQRGASRTTSWSLSVSKTCVSLITSHDAIASVALMWLSVAQKMLGDGGPRPREQLNVNRKCVSVSVSHGDAITRRKSRRGNSVSTNRISATPEALGGAGPGAGSRQAQKCLVRGREQGPIS